MIAGRTVAWHGMGFLHCWLLDLTGLAPIVVLEAK
jgi:hypothetical protein